MRRAVFAALIASVTLALPVSAQTQSQVTPTTVPEGEARAKAAVAECDRLLAFLNPSRPVAGVSMEVARRWKETSDVDQCRKALERVTQAAAEPPSDPNAPAPAAQAGSPGTPASPERSGSEGYGTTAGLAGAPGDATRAPADVTSGPTSTGALPGPTERIEVRRFDDMLVYSARGEKIGEVDDVVAGPDGRFFVVIEHGGFLGLGEKKSLLPLDQLALRDDRLVGDRMTDEDLKAAQSYDKDKHRILQDSDTAPVRIVR